MFLLELLDGGQRAGAPVALSDLGTQDRGELPVGRLGQSMIHSHKINVGQSRPRLTKGYVRSALICVAGPSAGPAAVTAIIARLLGAPHGTASPAACRALPFKGQVGRSLQDRGLTVALRVCEDLASFEATTDIEVTSPARPWLGTVTLSDDAALDWRCDLRAAFGGNPAALIDTITPVLRHR